MPGDARELAERVLARHGLPRRPHQQRGDAAVRPGGGRLGRRDRAHLPRERLRDSRARLGACAGDARAGKRDHRQRDLARRTHGLPVLRGVQRVQARARGVLGGAVARAPALRHPRQGRRAGLRGDGDLGQGPRDPRSRSPNPTRSTWRRWRASRPRSPIAHRPNRQPRRSSQQRPTPQIRLRYPIAAYAKPILRGAPVARPDARHALLPQAVDGEVALGVGTARGTSRSQRVRAGRDSRVGHVLAV